MRPLNTLKIFLSVLLLIFSTQLYALSYTVEISEEELQEKIAQVMPIEKKKLFLSVIFSHPKIDLAVGDNQIGIGSQIDVSAPGGIKSTGQAKIKGSLRYDGTTGIFYFQNPTIVQLQLDAMPDNFMPTIQEVAQMIVTKKLANLAIYRLKDNDLQQSLLKYTLKSIAITNKQLLIELALF